MVLLLVSRMLALLNRPFSLKSLGAGFIRHPLTPPLLILYLLYFVCLDAPLWRGASTLYDLGSPRNSEPAPMTAWGNRLLTYEDNLQIGEAQAWWRGALELPHRAMDTALHDGHIYNVYPPGFTLIAAAAVGIWREGVPHLLLVILLGLPGPFLAYRLFRVRVGRMEPAIWLAIAMVLGTSFLPVVERTLRTSQVYFVNHAIAVLGLLILLAEHYGRQRIGLMALGLAAAAWSRQLTLLYLPVLIAAAFPPPVAGQVPGSAPFAPPGASHQPSIAQAAPPFHGSWRKWAVPALALTVIAGVPMFLNTLKFQNPFDFGYRYIYVDLPTESPQAEAAKIGLFSPHFIETNAYYFNLSFPSCVWLHGRPRLKSSSMGTGVWWTTPLLLMLPLGLRRIIRRREDWPLLLTSLLVLSAILMYHTTGWAQRGFNRFSLDVLPVWLALLAPDFAAAKGWRAVLWRGAIVWSVVYFAMLI